MPWYGNGFHTIAPFVKEFHNTLVDSPHRGPVMQIFSVSFVVSLNKLLNQQFSCWWFERLCHCKNDTFMSHHDIIAKYNFLLFCISFRLKTHTCYKTYFFVFNHFSPRLQQLLYFRLCLVTHVQSSGVLDKVMNELLGWGQLVQCRVGGCWESPWHLIFPCPASCMPHQHPQWLWLTTDQWQK